MSSFHRTRRSGLSGEKSNILMREHSGSRQHQLVGKVWSMQVGPSLVGRNACSSGVITLMHIKFPS